MILSIPAPAALERKLEQTKIPPEFAYQAKHLDLCSELGRVLRGRGMARTADVTAQADTVLGAGVFTLPGCRKVLVDADDNGDLQAHVANAGNFTGGASCSGPMPDWMDLETEPGEELVIVPGTAEANTVIFSGAVAGKAYRVRAVGRWRNDILLDYLTCGPEGTTQQSLIGGAGTFSGYRHGAFMVKPPGGSWTYAPETIVVQAVSNGDILGSMADDDHTFSDNWGFMAVGVKEVGA